MADPEALENLVKMVTSTNLIALDKALFYSRSRGAHEPKARLMSYVRERILKAIDSIKQTL